MSQQTIVIATRTNEIATSLAELLRQHRCNVQRAEDPQQLAGVIARYRADAAIADLELVSLDEVNRLHNAFANVNFVCTHRVPDEQMWADSLSAGATD